MSDELGAEFATRIHEQIQQEASAFLTPSEEPDDDEPRPDTGLLTSWFLVCEWAGSDGKNWISYTRPPNQAQWRSRGLLAEALSDL